MRAARALLLAACLPTLQLRATADEPPAAPPPAAPAAPAPGPALDGGLSLVSLARAVRPSVLSVEVRSPGLPRVARQAVVVDAAGWLVLAGPTLGPNDTVVVRLSPEREVPAIPVGSDAGTALTLLQIPATDLGLQALTLPATQERRPLPPTPAIGSEVVMVTAEGAVARGRVRAAERARTMVDAAHGATAKATGLIEASLATVARDLGAPWVDSQGHCLGLLVGGISEDPLGDELPPDLQARPEPVASLAVPASVVALVWPMLQRHQSVPRSRMGLKARPAGEALRQHVCGGCGGQEITLVDEGGPAARAGIQPEDLLLALDGHPLRAGATLADELLPYRPMDTVVVTLVRHGERLQLSVVLTAR